MSRKFSFFIECKVWFYVLNRLTFRRKGSGIIDEIFQVLAEIIYLWIIVLINQTGYPKKGSVVQRAILAMKGTVGKTAKFGFTRQEEGLA
jgi:hypothetical protein